MYVYPVYTYTYTYVYIYMYMYVNVCIYLHGLSTMLMPRDEGGAKVVHTGSSGLGVDTDTPSRHTYLKPEDA